MDFGKGIADRVQNLASAQSAADAQAAIYKGSNRPHAPKTLYHALSRASLAGAELLGTDDLLGNALHLYSQAADKGMLLKFKDSFF